MQMHTVYMTTNPTNYPSIQTILHLGGEYIDTIEVPQDSSLYLEEKCDLNMRYLVNLDTNWFNLPSLFLLIKCTLLFLWFYFSF